MRHMNVIYIDEPDVVELQFVFGAILETHFAAAEFPPNCYPIGQSEFI